MANKEVHLKYILLIAIFIQSHIFASGIDRLKDQFQKFESYLVHGLDQDPQRAEAELTELLKFNNIFIDYSNYMHEYAELRISEEMPLFGNQLTILKEIQGLYFKVHHYLQSHKNNKVIDLESIYLWEKVHLFHSIYDKVYDNGKLRRFLNSSDMAFGIKFDQLKNNIMTLVSDEFIFNLRESYHALPSHLKERYQDVFNIFYDEVPRQMLRLKFDHYSVIDELAFAASDLQNRLSGDFGNTIGQIRWRKGHLLNKKNIHQEILENLRPLDIITEKTYFALTDKFIPGHFGHNAIWLGTKEQLEKINMWNHESIIPFHDDIIAGKSIIETDRSGTHLKSLSDFMNIDEFAILRFKENSLKDIRRIYKVALSQIGKVYDFNFDVETTNKLVCSELLYQSFGQINWPVEKLLGRVTISPDNVTSLVFYKDSPVDLVYYVAQKSWFDLRYKNINDLATDLELVEREGIFHRVETICDGENRENCVKNYIPLIYENHPALANAPSWIFKAK